MILLSVRFPMQSKTSAIVDRRAKKCVYKCMIANIIYIQTGMQVDRKTGRPAGWPDSTKQNKRFV